MSNRLMIAAVIYPIVAGVLFGIGVLPLLTFTQQEQVQAESFPFIVLASFLLAAPISWFLAPRLRSRYQRRKAQKSALQSQ